MGIDFPLFSAVSCIDQESLVKVIPTEIKHKILCPKLFDKSYFVVYVLPPKEHIKRICLVLSRLYQQHPEAIRRFTELKDQLLGKTSTSESVENIDLDLQEGTNIYTHVWFGSIAFQEKTGG